MRSTTPPSDGQKINRPLPSATIRKSNLTWLLWLIPVAAAALCVWFAYRDYVSAGPLITISFKDAGGLQEENTQVQYRGAQIGEVKKIRMAPDGQSVLVRVRLAGSAKILSRAGAIFWIVRPEVKVGAISGLQTIVSGQYIAIQPGNGPFTNSFTGAEEEPLAVHPNALQVIFLSHALDSLQEQSPVFYRGVQVGEVDYYQLGDDARQVVVHGRIWRQYAPLVRVNSKFWNAGGIDVHFGLFKGMQITAESPTTIISGGIEFATPPDYGMAASDGAVFDLNEKADEKWKTWAAMIPLHLTAEANPANPESTNVQKLAP